jgi:predicted MFS family arabinose efflux permease
VILTEGQRRVLGHRRFLGLWIATSVSELASNVGRLAFVLLVHDLARRAGRAPERDVALVMLLETLPMLLLGPFAGTLVDRFDRRRLLIACDVAAGLLLVSIPWLAGLPSAAPLFASALVFSAIATLFHPARQSAIPDVVPRVDLAEANGLSTVTASINLVGGFALGGLLIGLVGKHATFLVDAGVFALSASLLALLHLPRRGGRRAATGSFLRETWRGLAHLLERPVLRFLALVFFLTHAFVGAWYPVLPAFVERSLGRAPDRWVPLTLAAFGLGGVVGGATVPALVRRIGLGRALGVVLGALAAVLPLYATESRAPLTLVWAALGGSLVFALMVLDTTLVQHEAAPHLRGRIFGTRPPLQALGVIVGASAVWRLSRGDDPAGQLLATSLAFGVAVVAATLAARGGRALLRSPADAPAHPHQERRKEHEVADQRRDQP